MQSFVIRAGVRCREDGKEVEGEEVEEVEEEEGPARRFLFVFGTTALSFFVSLAPIFNGLSFTKSMPLFFFFIVSSFQESASMLKEITHLTR